MASTLNADNGVVSGSVGLKSSADSTGVLALQTNGTTAVTIDTAQNVGIGITPSAWGNLSSVLQMKNGATFAGYNSKFTLVGQNAYNSGAADVYINNGYASQYYQVDGTHVWRYAASGTAGASFSYTEAMRIDSSGNVGIGTSSPGYKLEIVKSNPSSTGAIARFFHGPASDRSIEFGVSASGVFPTYIQGRNTGSTTTDMALQPDGGNLLVGTTSAGSGVFVTQSSTRDLISCYNGASQKFAVGNNGQVYAVFTSISAISDISQKENVVEIPYGLTQILSLAPKKFDFKEELGGEKGLLGFIAQDVETILPELVKPFGDEGLLGLKMGDMLPVLVKAIQEQQALITTLTERIAALEAK